MIDSHCHLADAKFLQDLPDVLRRAKQAGISHMVTIADSLPESEKCIALCCEHDELFCSIGVHPHNAKDWNDDSERRLLALKTYSDKVKAIGEIGLDYHYDLSPREKQKEVFIAQLKFADCESLPVVVHCREAIADVRAILEKHPPSNAVLHCCTEKFEDVAWIIERGWFLSFTGIATYSNAEDIRNTIKQTPLTQLMIETDAPYLAPIPYRGKRNEPTFVVEVAKLIAEIHQVSLEEVDRITTQNAIQFFGLSKSVSS
jgi:TatD DNase family protein